MDKALVKLSRFVSLVLRHKPGAIGLSLDAGGWAGVDALITAAQRAGVPLTRERLAQIVAQNDKQRFAFSPDGQKIRASQGHSLPVDLGLPPVVPPEVLFHGTAGRFLPGIRARGLVRGRRQHVHLSSDEATARAVGGRHGSPVVLRVLAGRLHAAGGVFYQSANGVWLTEGVPPEYLVFPAD